VSITKGQLPSKIMGKTRAALPYDGIPSAPARELWIRFNRLHAFCENPQDPLIESVLSKKIGKGFPGFLETCLGNSHLHKYYFKNSSQPLAITSEPRFGLWLIAQGIAKPSD